MATKTFCDICDIEIKESKDQFYTRGCFLESKYFCKNCWTNKKNWPLIHKVSSRDDN